MVINHLISIIYLWAALSPSAVQRGWHSLSLSRPAVDPQTEGPCDAADGADEVVGLLHSHTDRALLELSGGPATYLPSNRLPDKLFHFFFSTFFWHTQFVDCVKELHWETGCSLKIVT